MLKKLNNKPDKVLIKPLNGYDYIREELEDNNALSIKKLISNEKPKAKVRIGLD